MARRLAASHTSALTAPLPWESRGPDEVGGRVRALEVDPASGNGRRLFAGGVNGGLWVLDDVFDPSGRWELASQDIEEQPVTSLAFDTSVPGTIYLGTGEGWIPGFGIGVIGTGVWKSVDNGAQWSPLGATSGFGYVNDLAVRQEALGSVLYVCVDAADYNGAGAGTNHGLYRSADGGQTFTQVLPQVAGSPFAPADIEIGPSGRLHVGTLANPDGQGGGAALFSDDGFQWTVTQIPVAVDRVKLSVSPSDPARVYALVEGGLLSTRLQRSTDGGATWNAGSAAPGLPGYFGYQPYYNLAIEASPTDPDEVWMGAVGLGRSVDGATSIQPIALRVHFDQHELRFLDAAPGNVVVANDGGVSLIQGVASANPSFAAKTSGLTVTQLYTVAMDPRLGADRFLVGTQDNDAMLLEGPGLTAASIAVDGDGAFCFFDANAPSLGLATRQGNVWHRTLDGGATWTCIPGQSGGGFINPADYDERRNILYSGATNATLQRISGVETTLAVDTIPVAFGPAPSHTTSLTSLRLFPGGAGSGQLFAGTAEGRLFRIDDPGGSNPTQAEIGGPSFPSASIACIEIGGTSNEIRIVFSNYGVASVWETMDGGATWRDVEGDLPDMPIRWILTDPRRADHVLLATELGIWETHTFDEAVPRWVPLQNAPPRVRTTMLRYRRSDGIVAAATYGRGLYTGLPFGRP